MLFRAKGNFMKASREGRHGNASAGTMGKGGTFAYQGAE